ncbi:MAG: hypothetical protein LBP59_11035 [Planctomycetaceae bacterium]|jgi:tRNA C32,U32 (ribose-2'-O)-methylase TrmJ|nr:hypothetical protein [Planctomycetaceae bacterium]
MNNNVADISLFESLQNGQTGSTSQMSVFNAITASEVAKLLQELESTTKKAYAARREAKIAYEKAWSMWQSKELTAEEHKLLDGRFRKAMDTARWASEGSADNL